MLCVRGELRFPTRDFFNNFLKLRARLYETYKHANCKGGICPHRHYDLSDVQPDSRGRIVCPLQGLVFNRDCEVIRDWKYV